MGKLKDEVAKAISRVLKMVSTKKEAKAFFGQQAQDQFDFSFTLEAPSEPDAIERLAAVTDAEIAKRVAFKELAREIWLEKQDERAETARNYAAQDVKATLSMYENYAGLDDFPELGLPFFANDATPVTE